MPRRKPAPPSVPDPPKRPVGRPPSQPLKLPALHVPEARLTPAEEEFLANLLVCGDALQAAQSAGFKTVGHVAHLLVVDPRAYTGLVKHRQALMQVKAVEAVVQLGRWMHDESLGIRTRLDAAKVLVRAASDLDHLEAKADMDRDKRLNEMTLEELAKAALAATSHAAEVV